MSDDAKWGPWVELDPEAAKCRKKAQASVVGGEGLSTGTGGLLVLLVALVLLAPR